MPRGGKRPGAGAPKRNFNALKTGRNTPRLYLLALYLLANPVIRSLYKRIYANLIKQRLSSKPVGPGQRSNLKDPTNSKDSMNSKNPVPPRGFIGVFVDGKCRTLYLAPKNNKFQSNFVFFIYTKNWGPDRNNQTTPSSERAQHAVPLQSPLPTLGRGRRRPELAEEGLGRQQKSHKCSKLLIGANSGALNQRA